MSLTILNDPTGATGRAVHELDYGITLQANIERHLQAGGDCELHINGVKVDPLTDPRLDTEPSMLDRVVVVRRPAGTVETWLLIASLALSVYSIATAPRPEDTPINNDSPNNKLTGQTNIARAYQAIPDVYGNPRVWPDLIQQSVVEYVDHVKVVTEWLCISRGRGTITDVKYADTPLIDIDGASFQVFEPSVIGPPSPGDPSNYPENQTTTLTDVFESFSAPDVNGQELGTNASPEPILRACTASFTAGSPTFTLEMLDGTDLANLKTLDPTGTTRIVFTYFVDFDPPVMTTFDAVCTVVSDTPSGGNVIFTFTAPFSISASGGQSVNARIYASATSSPLVGPFTLPQLADRIRFNVVFPRGLQGSVTIRSEWEALDSGGGVTAGGTTDHVFTAATFDARYYTREVSPGVGTARFRVKFRRITADLANGADVAKLESLFAVRFYATRVLPGVTVIKAVTKATEAATGVRERKFNLRFARHVRTLSTSAITEGSITASRNFARIMAHAWCVTGGSIAELDTTTLAALNTQHGETSPLLRFDGTLDDADMSLGQRLQLIADTARCKVWRDGTKWTVTRDQAQATHELQLDYRNLAGSGDSQVQFDGFMPASNDGVEVEYTDETTLSTRAYVRLTIAGGSVAVGTPNNPRRIRLAGCITTAQAENRAHLEARKLLYQRTSVTDTVLSDGGLLGLGRLVRWVDPNDFAGDDGLQAGEVLAIAGSVITTSEPLDWKGETSGRMQFTGVNGAPLGAPVVVTPVSGQPYQATLASVPGGLYVADGVNSQLGSRYAFGVGFTESEMEAAGLYVVERATPGANRTASIALLNYDERLYEED